MKMIYVHEDGDVGGSCADGLMPLKVCEKGKQTFGK